MTTIQTNNRQAIQGQGRPKKALTAYNFYYRDMSRSIRRVNRGLRYGDASKLIAERWALLPASEKTHYHMLAAEDKRRYALALIGFRVQQEEADATAAAQDHPGLPVEVTEIQPPRDTGDRFTAQDPIISEDHFVGGNIPSVQLIPPEASFTESFQEDPVSLQPIHQVGFLPVVAGNTTNNNRNNGLNELELFADEDLQFLEGFGSSI